MSSPNKYFTNLVTFAPKPETITAITNAINGQVTTESPHNYMTGQIVRLLLPKANGAAQLNNQIFTITVDGASTFLINFDTSLTDPFLTVTYPPAYTPPQVAPIGILQANYPIGAEQNSGLSTEIGI